jgi:hypothetical protein
MFANLLKNAVEASPPGGKVTITFRDNPCEEDAPAEISIHNEGAVPAAIRERFFQKFATAGKKHGTGDYSARLMALTPRRRYPVRERGGKGYNDHRGASAGLSTNPGGMMAGERQKTHLGVAESPGHSSRRKAAQFDAFPCQKEK